MTARGPHSAPSVAPHRAGVWPLVSAAEMQTLDRETIDRLGVPGEVLMESAGRALLAPVLELLRGSGRRDGPVRVFCGAGNNGGDGFVLVRHLHGEGVAAEALLFGDPEKLPTDAARNWDRLQRVGAVHRVAAPDADVAERLDETPVLVDALFGTGLGRPISGALATWIEAVEDARQRGLRVLSVDMPSGICANTGQVLGTAIRADQTVTISLPKIGLGLEPGRSHAGAITVARVGIADPPADRMPRVELWNARAAAARLPARPRAGHKGSFGHVLVATGSPGKMGAAALCARAAVRAGAGLVTVAYPEGLAGEIGGIPIEAMTQAVASTEEGFLASASTKALVELAAARDVVALGPGLGRDTSLRAFVPQLATSIGCPMVIDADGLHALTGQLEGLRERSSPTVLTPHPGEAASLLGTEAASLNRDRVGAARELATRSGSIVVLKGAATVVANPNGRTLIVSTGGPALATGGTGDVLTGVVAALLAGGLEPFDAAGLAAWWHGATADRWAASRLPFGLMAGELADALPECAAALAAGGLGGATAGGAATAVRGEGEGEDLALRFPGP